MPPQYGVVVVAFAAPVVLGVVVVAAIGRADGRCVGSHGKGIIVVIIGHAAAIVARGKVVDGANGCHGLVVCGINQSIPVGRERVRGLATALSCPEAVRCGALQATRR